MLTLTVSGLEDIEQLKIVLGKLTAICVAPVLSHIPWEYCHFLLTSLGTFEFFIVKNKQKSNKAVLMRKIIQLVVRTKSETLLSV